MVDKDNVFSFSLFNVKLILILVFDVQWINCGTAEIYTSQNFDLVRTTTYPHFIMFYAPWCGHCKRVQSMWDKYAAEHMETRKLKVAKVDCAETTELCANENIKAYPTFRLFNQDQKYTFRGNRNIPALNKFLEASINNLQYGQVPILPSSAFEKPQQQTNTPNKPVKARLFTADIFQQEIEKDYSFIDFYAPWCPHCVRLEPVWDELATKFKDNPKIKIAKVDCTVDPDLCLAQNINAYPTLKLFQNGHYITQYKNGHSLTQLIEFIEMTLVDSVATDKIVEKEIDEEPGILEGDAVFDDLKDEESVDYIDPSVFDSNVKTLPHLIYFHNGWFQTSDDHINLLDDLLSRIKENAIVKKPNVKLGIINCNAEHDYCAELEINSYPLLRYYKNEKVFVDYNGPFITDAVLQFLYDESSTVKGEL